jgi:RNA polymerase sigma factor (sigma-70 family)
MPGFLASRTERSFERLYQQHVGDVYRYTLAVLRNSADAEDVTQTTFLNAYRAYQNGERPRQPHNWLIAIAHNVCRQRFRQSQRRVEEVAYEETIAEAMVPEEDAPSADDIRRAISHLAFNQRAALVMRELEGRSYAEIAEILGLSIGAVETLIFRARRALREQLEGGLTCRAAELAISRQLDGRLPRSERGPLRAHLRECQECASVARKLRAQRSAIKALGLVPLPPSLATFFGGSAAAGGVAAGVTGAVAAKAAMGVAAGIVLAGSGYELAHEQPWRGERSATPPAAASSAVATADAVAVRSTRSATPAPLALAPGERDAAAPFGRAIGRGAAVPPGRVRAAEAKAAAAERKEARAEKPKPERSKRAAPPGRERAQAAKAAKAQRAAKPETSQRPARTTQRRPKPLRTARTIPSGPRRERPAVAAQPKPKPDPPRAQRKRQELPAPLATTPVGPVVEDVVETVTEPLKKIKR